MGSTLTLNLLDVFVTDLLVELLQPLQGRDDRPSFPGQGSHPEGRQDADCEGPAGDEGAVATGGEGDGAQPWL